MKNFINAYKHLELKEGKTLLEKLFLDIRYISFFSYSEEYFITDSCNDFAWVHLQTGLKESVSLCYSVKLGRLSASRTSEYNHSCLDLLYFLLFRMVKNQGYGVNVSRNNCLNIYIVTITQDLYDGSQGVVSSDIGDSHHSFILASAWASLLKKQNSNTVDD